VIWPRAGSMAPTEGTARLAAWPVFTPWTRPTIRGGVQQQGCPPARHRFLGRRPRIQHASGSRGASLGMTGRPRCNEIDEVPERMRLTLLRKKSRCRPRAGSTPSARGRGPPAAVRMGRMHQAPGRSAAAGAGTGSRFFGEADGGPGGGYPAWHIIHPIAIGKSLPEAKSWITIACARPRAGANPVSSVDSV
jgi:hypothetical protein